MSQSRECYAKAIGGCEGGISREHYISGALLRYIAGPNKVLDLQGLKWFNDGGLARVSPASLVSKILCRKHNSDLHPLDDVAADFIRPVEAIFRQDFDEIISSNELVFDFRGRDIERWMLKMICGGIALGLYGEDLRCVPRYLVEILFEKVPWPKGLDLYTTERKLNWAPERPFLNLTYRRNCKTGEPAGLDSTFLALDMTLMLGNYLGVPGIRRPRKLLHKNDERELMINLSWDAL